MMITKLELVLTVINLFLIFVRPEPHGIACNDDGMCFWQGSGWYRGCIDTPILTFDRFYDDGILDLRCSEVRVVYIISTALSCKEMNVHVITDKHITFYLGELKTKCVSNLLYYSVIKTYNNISA